MGRMKDLFVGNATDEETKAMIDNSRDLHEYGYVKFLEDKLYKAEKMIRTIKEVHEAEKNIELSTNTITTLIDLYFHDDDNNNKKESLNGN
jgi:uncharacterized membrane protein YgaE (UPF0421/DUF939 family)